MLRVISKKQMLALLSGGGVALFLSIPIFYSTPIWAKFVMLFIVAYTVYLTLRLFWIMVLPADSSVSLKSRATLAQQGDLCWICGRNHQGHRTLEVGYRRPTPRALHSSIVDTVLICEGLADDIHLSAPICERCARRYVFLSKFGFFAPLGLDRSFRVLRRKPGYLRGMQHPFEPSNIKTAN
jgi:hypothetical protein